MGDDRQDGRMCPGVANQHPNSDRQAIREVRQTMRAHWFQHVPFEGLGSIEPWLEAHDFEVSRTRWYADETPPCMDGIDFLIVMGGPMSVNEEEGFPWLVREKQCVREFMETGKPVLGICLGAQLIASSLGAGVRRTQYKQHKKYQRPSHLRFPLSTDIPVRNHIFIG